MRRPALALLAAVGIAWGAQAAAQDLGTFQSWRAHQFTERSGQVCMMWSSPRKAEGKYTQRGEILAFVSHRPAEERAGIVGFKMGYPFASGEKLRIAIDDRSPVLVPASGDIASDDSPEVNGRLVQWMREGGTMVATGRSRRGTKTVDTYSLSGFTAAYRAISEACGIR